MDNLEERFAVVEANTQTLVAQVARIEKFIFDTVTQDMRLKVVEKRQDECDLKDRVVNLESTNKILKWAAGIAFGALIVSTVQRLWPHLARAIGNT
jgi:hypothetical protein